MASHSPPPTAGIAFIDFEASGLGPQSWPIEVGWSLDDGVTESFLISPAPDWPMTAWDGKAERLHGITPRMLADLGLDAAATCERLDAALAGRTVYSDAPDWDSFWMLRLYQAARRRCAIKLEDFARAMPPLTPDQKAKLLQQADRLAPRRHRAAEDALHLRMIHRLAVEGVRGG
ncbi:MAG TPA: transcriptional regulator [Parvularcula sp.]|nr:transcriptional regulator [Parvularcula sp.]